MKKTCTYLVLCLICTTLFLTGCADRTYYFNYDEMVEKTVRIDIAETNGGTDRQYESLLKTLPNELLDDFLLDLSKIKFTKPAGISNLSFPEGISFFIYYKDNDYDIINYYATSIGDYPDARCSLEEYNYLVNKYYGEGK